MKRIKRELNLSKEDVEYHIYIASYHRTYLNSKAIMIQLGKDFAANILSPSEYIKQKNEIRMNVLQLWKDLNDKLQNS